MFSFTEIEPCNLGARYIFDPCSGVGRRARVSNGTLITELQGSISYHGILPKEALWLAPEAFQILEPDERKSGRVFSAPEEFTRVCRTISAIGKQAGVIVDVERGKYASAHDLRRAFGLRWSKRVDNQVLKQLMRHSSISTTLAYYANQSAESAAVELWSVSGNTLRHRDGEMCCKRRRKKLPVHPLFTNFSREREFPNSLRVNELRSSSPVRWGSSERDDFLTRETLKKSIALARETS